MSSVIAKIKRTPKTINEIEGEIAKTTVGRQAFVLDPNGVRICLIEHTEEYKKKYMWGMSWYKNEPKHLLRLIFMQENI